LLVLLAAGDWVPLPLALPQATVRARRPTAATRIESSLGFFKGLIKVVLRLDVWLVGPFNK
jgi:hypothetical protein